LIDSNVFVAAIKNPRKSTRTLELLLKMIEDPTISLVGNDLLTYEMVRYAELLKSPIAAALVAALLNKTALVSVSERYRKICTSYLKTPDPADVLHAATCLQAGAVLITNDRHFTRIGKERIVDVRTIAEAIRELLGSTE
jgi:predicted nucleic acid-binding protein